jgi:alkylation response protein AidB-like acyl-CoA dehydrogenase
VSPDFAFDDAQLAVADAVARFCREQGAEGLARADGAPPRAFWRGLAALGVFALAAPDGEGGAAELAAAFEALGRAACPGPLVATVLAAQLLPAPERAALVAGEAWVAVGTPPLLPFAPVADLFVDLAGDEAWLARPRGRVTPVASLGGEPFGRLALERLAPLPGLPRARALGDLARAAWLVGAGQALLDAAADHARTRRQFGRAIGEFQAVAHPLADAWIALRAAESLERAAAFGWDASRADAALAAGAARLSAARAGLRTLRAAHQTLGALGVTLEGPLFHLSRRVRQLAALPPGPEPAEAALLEPLGLAGGAP